MTEQAMSARDRMIDVALENELMNGVDATGVADAILAALPSLGYVHRDEIQVKPLVWDWESDFHCIELFVTKTVLGQYSAFATAEEGAGYYVELEDGALDYSDGPFDTMETAKAAANAHHAARLMAELGGTV